jgi:hypothetical protein
LLSSIIFSIAPPNSHAWSVLDGVVLLDAVADQAPGDALLAQDVVLRVDHDERSIALVDLHGERSSLEGKLGRSARASRSRKRFGRGEVTVGAVRNHGLPRLEAKRVAVELYRNEHPHATAQRLGVEEPLWRIGREEPADCSR